MTHHYVRSRDLTWHVVTAGDRARPVVVFLHGMPETWFAFHHQMADLSRDRFVVALDVPPYGQTEKSAEIDYSYPALAARVVGLVADIGVDEFDLVAHDRGAVIGDHMAHVIAADASAPRIRRYVRMQQSGDQPHGEPGLGRDTHQPRTATVAPRSGCPSPSPTVAPRSGCPSPSPVGG